MPGACSNSRLRKDAIDRRLTRTLVRRALQFGYRSVVAVVDVETRARTAGRAFCAAVSSESGEPLAATASRVDHWILVEYRGAWARDALGGSLLSAELKEHLRAQLAALAHSRLLLRQEAGAPCAGRRPRALRRITARGGALLRAGARAPRRPARRRPRGGARRRRSPVPAGRAGRSSSSARTASATAAARCTGARCTTRSGTRPTRRASGSRRTSAATASPATSSCFPQRPLLRAGRPRATPPRAGRGARRRGDRARPLPRAQRLPFPVQAAEHALRESEGLLGIDDLDARRSRAATGTARGGSASARRTRRSTSSTSPQALADEPAYLTCESAEPSTSAPLRGHGALRVVSA